MLLTVKEVSQRLKVNVNYVYKLINSGILPHLKLGSIKVREEALNKFLAEYEGRNVDEVISNG
jgi:excisionase family DNA binding protein